MGVCNLKSHFPFLQFCKKTQFRTHAVPVAASRATDTTETAGCRQGDAHEEVRRSSRRAWRAGDAQQSGDRRRNIGASRQCLGLAALLLRWLAPSRGITHSARRYCRSVAARRTHHRPGRSLDSHGRTGGAAALAAVAVDCAGVSAAAGCARSTHRCAGAPLSRLASDAAGARFRPHLPRRRDRSTWTR